MEEQRDIQIAKSPQKCWDLHGSDLYNYASFNIGNLQVEIKRSMVAVPAIEV